MIFYHQVLSFRKFGYPILQFLPKIESDYGPDIQL